MSLRLDYTNLMDAAVAGGVTDAELAAAAETFRSAHEEVKEDHEAGRLGFIDLPINRRCFDQVDAYAASVRGRFRDVVVLGNVDPLTIGALLARLDLRRTLFVVTSKSGGTAETMAQSLVVRDRLERTLGADAAGHLVFVTDPEKGALRALARREGVAALDVPENVGGRFS